jgi:hypothetical protein
MTEGGTDAILPPSMPHGSLFSHYTSYFWAMASLVPLPLALLILPTLGISAFASFALGIVLTGCVLAMNALIEGRVWIMHEEWHHVFSHPHASFRLAIVAGSLLLVIESAVLLMILASPGADEAMLALVLHRQCVHPQGIFLHVCEVFQP